MILDAEAIVGTYLRALPAVEDLEARVLGKTPATLQKPWVRITQHDAQNVSGTSKVEHLVAYWLQFDCYAGASGGQAEASSLNAAIRTALVAMPTETFDGAVVTDVEILSNPRQPDDDLDPARERFVLDAQIYMHPKP